MIEINLLPGDAKKKKKGGAKTSSGVKFEFHPSQWFAGISEKITDKYMLGAVAAVGVSGALIVLLFISQTARAAMLESRETKAVKDSAQYSAVLTAKSRAEATRDSLYQQIAVITVAICSIAATSWCLFLLSRLVTWATSGVDVAGYAAWLRDAHVSRSGQAEDEESQEYDDANREAA